MIRFLGCVAIVSLSTTMAGAQGPTMPGAPAIVLYQKSAELAPVPQTVPVPCTQKVCVTEVKKNTRVVYTSRCKEFCMPSCSIFSWFRGECGCCNGNCGDVWTRKVLVKKTVPDCDTTQCVLKEVPVSAVPCPPCPTGRQGLERQAIVQP